VGGQGLFFGSPGVLLYAAALALAFHLFVVFVEEPGLRRRFGPSYEAYCRRVPRWLPRLGSGARP
jgi:protein-S-isoprenylcysteine O-methyltransferase Ste14